MKNNYTKEVIVSAILVILLVVLWNPAHFLMTSMVHMTIAGLSLVFFGFLAALILREQVVDERDETHRSLAGRMAFLVGSTTLLIGILVQVVQDRVDVWLVAALVLMVITKIATRLYSAYNG